MKDFYKRERGTMNLITRAFVPVLIYYAVYNAAVILGLSVLEILKDKPALKLLEENAFLYIESFIKMTGMALGGLAVCPYYKREKSCEIQKSLSIKVCAALIVTGALLSLGINFLFAVTGLTGSSESYQQVAKNQFSLPLWLAVLFYGILSPVVEETVFRGIVYNALARNTSKGIGIVGSALLFGVFHGNPVQMLYGSLMGVIMAYIYQKYQNLTAPVLFHGAANVAIYAVTYFF